MTRASVIIFALLACGLVLGGLVAGCTSELPNELGHDLGLPDLYDTDGSSRGIGIFGLMGNGVWGNATDDIFLFGATPALLSAWSKEYLGFIAPVVISESQTGAVLAASSTDPTVYRIETSDPNQYFLLENRSLSGYDQGLVRWGLSEGGLAIWHIDNSVQTNRDENHKMVDLEEAEDGYIAYSELDESYNFGDEEDLFRAGWADPFDDAHAPDARLYDGTLTEIEVSSISAAGEVMTIDITIPGGGEDPPPPPPPVSELEIIGERGACTVNLNWTGAEEQEVSVYRVYRSETLEGPFELAAETYRQAFGEKPPIVGDLYYTVTAVDGQGAEGTAAEPILLAGPASPGDTDGDGVADEDEDLYGTDVSNPDTDGDGFGDGAELSMGFDPLERQLHPGSEYDTDGDLLTDEEEMFLHFTDPYDADGDDDGLTDYQEIFITSTNPNHPFTDEVIQ